MNTKQLLLKALLSLPNDQTARQAYADLLEEEGDSAGAGWMRGVGEMTGKQFSECVVAQDDDEDYQESGYVICVVGELALLAGYGHCSCYNTWSDLNGGGIGDYFEEDEVKHPAWQIVVPVPVMAMMAYERMDPALPPRIADQEDSNYDHLVKTYGQFLEWYKTKWCPNDVFYS